MDSVGTVFPLVELSHRLGQPCQPWVLGDHATVTVRSWIVAPGTHSRRIPASPGGASDAQKIAKSGLVTCLGKLHLVGNSVQHSHRTRYAPSELPGRIFCSSRRFKAVWFGLEPYLVLMH